MNLDELIAARPIPASEPIPDRFGDEKRIWTALSGKIQERLVRKEVTRGSRRLGRPEAQVESFRPAWAALDYLPRMISHRMPRLSRRSRWLLKAALLGSWSPRAIGAQYTFSIQEALSRTYPWNTIGKVLVGSGNDFLNVKGTGSGVLVGRNLMMTASHVAPWDTAGWWMRFVPGYNDRYEKDDGKEPFGHSYIQQFRGVKVKKDDDPSGEDYVICRLYNPLGEQLGWMGSRSFGDEDDYYNGTWISVGYPTDFMNGQKPAVEFDIDIDDIDDDGDGLELETGYNQAFGGGWSGGPLWGWIDGGPRVIGIKSGWEVDVYDPARGVFAGGGHLVSLVKHGLAHWQ